MPLDLCWFHSTSIQIHRFANQIWIGYFISPTLNNFTSQAIPISRQRGSLVRVRSWHVETPRVEIHRHPVHALLVSHLEFTKFWTIDVEPSLISWNNSSYPIKLKVSGCIHHGQYVFFNWLLCGKPNHTQILGDLHILFLYISWLGHSLVLIHMCIFMDASTDSRANNSASTIEFHLLPSSFIDFHIIYHPIYPYQIIYSVYIYTITNIFHDIYIYIYIIYVYIYIDR